MYGCSNGTYCIHSQRRVNETSKNKKQKYTSDAINIIHHMQHKIQQKKCNKQIFVSSNSQSIFKVSIAGCLLSSFHCPSSQIRELLKNFSSNANVGSGVLS